MSIAESEVNRVVAAFAETWNRHDMGAFAELFAADAEFVNVVGMWWTGRAEIEEAHRFTHSTIFKDSRLTMSEVKVRFPVPQIAIARSKWVLEDHVAPDGAAVPARNGVLVTLLMDQGGKWQIIDAQNTDIIEDVVSRPQ